MINVISSISIGFVYLFYVFLKVQSNMYMLYFALSIQIFTQFVSIEWMNEAFRELRIYTF